MRLLNPFFSRSKREQDKPIRDKLKDKKYFEKMLSIKLGEIADDEKYIQKKEIAMMESYDLFYIGALLWIIYEQ